MESGVRTLLRPYLSLLIIFPFNKDIASWMAEYVPSVNQEQVDPVDVLSDNMYVYRRDSMAVEIWKEKFA